jgi:organic hydroperoxide reductase OsmC/OhrA
MQALPHRYRVKGAGRTTGDVELTAERLTMIQSASPAEFDGPGDRWSPETLLVGALADCFILTFRAVAKASRLSWISLDCDVTGTLDRPDRVTQFTRFDMLAHLVVPAGEDTDRARQALEKAERNCLISRSLKASFVLDVTVEIAEPAELCLASTTLTV